MASTVHHHCGSGLWQSLLIVLQTFLSSAPFQICVILPFFSNKTSINSILLLTFVLSTPCSCTKFCSQNILPSNTSCSNPSCRNRWPIHLCLWHQIVFNIFLSSWAILWISSFVFWSTQLIFIILFQIHFSKASSLLLSACVNVRAAYSATLQTRWLHAWIVGEQLDARHFVYHDWSVLDGDWASQNWDLVPPLRCLLPWLQQKLLKYIRAICVPFCGVRWILLDY